MFIYGSIFEMGSKRHVILRDPQVYFKCIFLRKIVAFCVGETKGLRVKKSLKKGSWNRFHYCFAKRNRVTQIFGLFFSFPALLRKAACSSTSCRKDLHLACTVDANST